MWSNPCGDRRAHISSVAGNPSARDFYEHLETLRERSQEIAQVLRANES